MEHLHSRSITNEFTDTFPGDTSMDRTTRQTPGVLYCQVMPTPVAKPTLLAWSDAVAFNLGLDQPDELDVSILGGNAINPQMKPYASCYAGHQFGNWAGQLGDGRAISLGFCSGKDGVDYELQLKGAGPTPYSRNSDGRAVLRSSLREYLMSEAMHHLGVPTTRALSLVATGDPVLRDMFYNGHPEYEPGAVVLRVAPSFIRFGNFEILAERNYLSLSQQLCDWVIERYYPEITGEDRVVQLFRAIAEKTANMIVEWLRVGFVHGVMNTDNMSILGLTIDYGPYSFLDEYEERFTPNTTDLPGRRYAFGNQAAVAYWNLGKLANALAFLVHGTDKLVAVLKEYQDLYEQKYYTMMAKKLGFDQLRDEDRPLIDSFEEMLRAIKPDMTIFYQLLIELPENIGSAEDVNHFFEASFYTAPDTDHLYAVMLAYNNRIKANSCTREVSVNTMRAANPRFVLRNYILHEAISKLEKGDDGMLKKLEKYIQNPYSREADEYFAKRPDWARQKAGCSMLSCSS
ncbi:MAG: protein adenylyltransferase SelO [Cytophaga sp.]|uniref:protein adenylyltransferase SelO n=1 Tax=Cytophaga sp. TaxID=29535 RepID=UPI003F8109CA